MKKAVITKVIYNTFERCYSVRYESGAWKMYSYEKAPKTVIEYLKSHPEEERDCRELREEDEKLLSYLDRLEDIYSGNIAPHMSWILKQKKTYVEMIAVNLGFNNIGRHTKDEMLTYIKWLATGEYNSAA